MAETRNDSGGGGLGFKFNSTGSDNTTTQVLQPKIDTATKLRRTGLIAVAAVALLAILGLSFLRSGLNPFEKPKEGPGFNAPVHNVGP